MTKKQIEQFCKKTRALTKRVAKSKAVSRKALIDAGILTKKGRLEKCYKIEEQV